MSAFADKISGECTKTCVLCYNKGMGILDIQSGDISALSPGDLQELVGRLCQAELMKRGLRPTGATWGGNINTRDGGVDVLVDTDARISESGFIPKGVTAFQVKQTEMGVAKVGDEMLDGKGRLKQAIAEVFQGGGAYIVVSGKDSAPPLGPVGIDERKQSMRKAAKDYPNGFVDFYGNDRIAQWVRCHSSLALWVREQKREARYGWKPYGDWSYPPLGDTDAGTYITQKGMVLLDRVRKEPLPIVEAINALRKTMRERALPVRIVGLAGTGKTRLMQALFDSKVGEAPLNKYEVVYADSGANPEPSPVHFAEVLAAKQDFVVLIVDNCSRKLHDKLAEVCRAKGSRVKLVTVDLDVRKDIPLETDAFELICEKGEMVRELLNRRCEDVNQVNKETINRLCGGNARMALILADAVQRAGNANLNDENFLDCLFWQRQDSDKELKRTAEVCSLLYSFGVAGDAAGELEMLASLVGRTPESLFDDVGKLVDHGIAQARGNMRAILPEALANRFAADALKIPAERTERIVSAVTGYSERVLKSFSRRLGCLHDSEAAQKIAKKWLSPGGYLDAQGEQMSHRQMEVLENIAPISPRTTMEFIQRAEKSGVLSLESRHFGDFARLLSHLAYCKELFDDAAGVLCRMAMLTPRCDSHNTAFDTLSYLFQISLSGTHATLQQRLDIVRELTKESQPEEKWQLGLELLSSALKTHLYGRADFGFGAHARDFGYRPQGEDARDWFASFINHAADLAVSETPAAPKAATVLADHFREMWECGMDKELDVVARKVKAGGNWHEMALAVIRTILFDGKEMAPERLKHLTDIRELFSPEKQNLQNRFKMFFADSHHALSFADFSGQEISAEKVRDRIHALGVEIAGSKRDFDALLPEMLGGAEYGDRFSLGQGIADGCNGDYQKIWGGFRAHLPGIEKDKRNFGVPMGFINTVAKKASSDAVDILEKAIEDEVFAPAYPNLETSAWLSEGAPARLKKSLDLGVASPEAYRALGWGRYHEKFGDADMVPLIRSIAQHPKEGTWPAVEILSMRFYGMQKRQYMPDESMRKCGRDVVLGVNFSVRDSSGSMSYNVGRIIDACFRLPEAEAESRKLCRKLVRALKRHRLNAEDRLFLPLARWQPKIFLDAFVPIVDSHYAKDLCNAVSEIEPNTIIDWCKQDPEKRCPCAALVVGFLEDSEGGGEDLTPIARRLIENASDKTKVLDYLWAGTFSWSSGWGTHVQMLEERLALFAKLSNHGISEVAEWARQRAESTRKDIEAARKDDKEANAFLSPSGFE